MAIKLRDFGSAAERRGAIEKETGVKLAAIGLFALDESVASKKNVENMIGAAQVPMGIAGPLKLDGKEYYLPMATSEGALVASVSRGCAAIREAGGASAIVIKSAMTRAPAFKLASAAAAKAFTEWVAKNNSKIAAAAEAGSRFLKVKAIRPWIVGRTVYLRFECATGDAMGMNMVTIGTQQACDYIVKETGAECVSVSGNMCIDKKPAALTMIEGRGKSVVAEVFLPDKVIKETLKAAPEAIVDAAYRKNLLGSALAGSYGFNTHVANTAAAMYIALGQDPAQVVNASIGFSLFEREKGGVHASLTLPAIEVGTVGGGTGLATQREALELLGVAGAGTPAGANAEQLAMIICAACLAGEISGIAAQAAHHLAKAHKELGR